MTLSSIKDQFRKQLKNVMKYFTIRNTNLYGLIVCMFLLGFSAYLQISLKLEPCPLCIVQRVLIVILGLLFLAGTFMRTAHVTLLRVHDVFIMLFGLLGVGVAGRQIWLQSFPPEFAPACGPSLDYMLKYLPITQTIKMLITGTGHCSEIQWTFLGISIPQWTLGFFVAAIILAGFNFWRAGRKRHMV